MRLPSMQYVKRNRMATQVQFGGMNHTQGARDGEIWDMENNFVDFDHGKTLIQSGNAKYEAEVVVGITDTGDAVFYDVVDLKPVNFQTNKSESPTTATTQNALGDIHGNPDGVSVPEKRGDVNGQFSLSPVGNDRKVGEKVKADINAAGEKDEEPEKKQTDQASTGLSTGNAEVDRILGLR